MPCVLQKCILHLSLALLITQMLYAAIGPEDKREYIVLLPAGLSKQNADQQLMTYFETNQPPAVEFFPDLDVSGQSRWALLESEELTPLKLDRLYANGRVLYYQKNHVYRVHDSKPNDPLYSAQWYHREVGAAQVWDRLPVDTEIIIGVIDTGIEYTHPDLQNCIWVNRKEDLNHNMILDSTDINGLDDDGNGYVDDVVGWDFTDAPRFRDSGDYLDPDNDPADEYFNGHGTQIAGILAAEIDNNIGIAGLLPHLKVMNLRAGTANGYLEEDDVARAILYAMQNGARVINMSFGDTEVSRFLSDVLFYAYSKGMVLVASAGNSADNQIHFPAALSETIAVGASNKAQQRAGFSSWGGLLDLIAPGEDLIACSRKAGYNNVQGTSFSAPMVSAAAGMMLMLQPDFSNENVRRALRSSARDIDVMGWDPYTGSGILDFPRLMDGSLHESLQIHYPAPGTSLAHNTAPIIITVKNPVLRGLSIQYGVGEHPSQWLTAVSDYPYQVIEDSITSIDLRKFADTTMVIRLIADDWLGGQSEFRSPIYIDRSPPVMHNLRILDMLDGERSGILIEFETDDLVQADLFYRSSGQSQSFDKRTFRFETRNHRIILNSRDIPRDGEFYIELRNRSGLITTADNGGHFHHWQLPPDPVWSPDFNRVPWTFPAGYALASVTDLDQNGFAEVILSRYDLDYSFGPMQIYEFVQDAFELKAETAERMIPRDAGDADGDGLPEILAGFGQRTYLLEAETQNKLPTQICWQDSNFWGSRITDLDRDGRFELLGRRADTFVLLEAEGDNFFKQVFRFENNSPGENALGPPRTVVADFDGDQKLEIIFGDYDGDLIVYENVGDDDYRFTATIKLPFPDATDFFTTWPQRNGNPLLVAGCYQAGDNNYEHEFEARYWEYRTFVNDGSDNFIKKELIRINGYSDLRFFDAGVASLNLGEEVMLACAPYPNLYLIRFSADGITPYWSSTEVRTNTVIAYDFNRNGLPEVFFSNGKEFIAIETADKPRPPAPQNFSVTPLDTHRISLRWDPVAGADYYVVYRGASQMELHPLDSTYHGIAFEDESLIENQLYVYAVKTVSSVYPQKYSPLSRSISVRPNRAPRIDTLLVLNKNQLQVIFNEPMLTESLVEDNFRLIPGDITAHSVVPFDNFQSVLITFDQSLITQMEYDLQVEQVRDLDRTIISDDKQIISFRFEQGNILPYIKKWYLENRHHLQIEFNTAMDISTVLKPENYRLHPSGKVLDVEQSDTDGRQFRYVLSDDSYTGATGMDARFECLNLRSAGGAYFTEGNEINLTLSATTLAYVLPYPQPATTEDMIIFANVPDDTEINIFDLRGMLIRRLSPRQFFGGMQWDLKNNNGEKVAAGIYIYTARTPSETKMGKLTVIR